MELWEILVPTLMGDKPIRTRYHRVWDSKVRQISGGLSILTPIKGQWINSNQLYEERMIPVRIACTKSQILEIIQFSLDYYKQIAIMAYKLSDDVLILKKGETCL